MRIQTCGLTQTQARSDVSLLSSRTPVSPTSPRWPAPNAANLMPFPQSQPVRMHQAICQPSVLSAPVPPYWPGIEGTGCPSHAHHTSPQTGDWAGGFPAAWGQERLRSLKTPPRQVPALPAQPLMGSPLPTCPPGQMECRSVGQSQLLPTSDLRPTPPSVRGCEEHPTKREEGVPGTPTVPSVIAGDAVSPEGFQAH